jgi:cytochrome c biogenesis protein ResB
VNYEARKYYLDFLAQIGKEFRIDFVLWYAAISMIGLIGSFIWKKTNIYIGEMEDPNGQKHLYAGKHQQTNL